MVNISIEVNSQKVELFKDEGVKFVKKALDYERVSSNYSDYSQGFTVPATPRNNEIFKHYYNPEVTNGFDPFTTNSCRIFINGQVLANGTVRLVKINMKFNQPDSYSIQFFSDNINLTEKLKDTTIADIDWSIYNHAYTVPLAATYLGGTAITAAGETAALYYPFVSTRSLLKWDNPNSLVYKEGVSFISAGGAGVLFDEFRPAAPIDFIMTKLFDLAGFEVDNKLQLDDTYNKSYLWLNNGEDYVSSATSIQKLDAQLGGNIKLYGSTTLRFRTIVNDANGMAENGGFRASVTDTYNITIEWYNTTIDTFNLRLWINGVTGTAVTVGGAPNSHTFNVALNAGDLVLVQALLINDYDYVSISSITSLKVRSVNSFTEDMVVGKFVPRMESIKFIQGVLDMFNALLYYDNVEGKFVIQNRLDWLNDGNEIDISKYVDSENITLRPPTFFNAFEFNFLKGNDISSLFYFDKFQHSHGSTRYNTGNVFGETYKKTVPFTLPMVQLIQSDEADPTAAPAYIGQLSTTTCVDKAYSQVDANGMIFIKEGTRDAVLSWKIRDYTGTTATGTLSNDFRIDTSTAKTIGFSPTLAVNQTLDSLRTDTLFQTYYSEFITEFYNNQVRRYSLSAYLPFAMINQIKPNTTIIINRMAYRIEDITTDTLTGKSALNLITKTI